MPLVHSAFWKVLFRLRNSGHYWATIRSFESSTPQEKERMVAQRLMDQVRFYSTLPNALPEWKEAARITDPSGFMGHWHSLPILTKEDLRTKFHPDSLRRLIDINGRTSSTGGSTGEPTPFIRDAPMLEAVAAIRAYVHLQFGWRPDMATICVWGSDRDIGKLTSHRAKIVSRLQNFQVVDGYEMNSDTVIRFVEALSRHSSVAVYGFTSMLEYVAREVLAAGIEIPRGKILVAWNGGETLHPYQSELFQRAFGVPILNLYGGRELGPMAYQPEANTPLRVLLPYLVLDIVDDSGCPVQPGETGRLILTSTICRGTPFLRYEVGDLGCSAPNGVGSIGVELLASVEGRQGGILQFPNRKKIQSLYWNHLFKEFPEVHQFQVALVENSRLELRFRGTGMEPDREAQLRGILRSKLGDFPVSIKWMDKIPLTSQGKLLQVVRE